MMMDKEGLIL